MPAADFADLNPSDAAQNNRKRKRKYTEAIEAAWHYFEAEPSGIPIVELIEAVAADIKLGMVTVKEYLRIASAKRTAEAVFERFDNKGVEHLRPKPDALRRRQRERVEKEPPKPKPAPAQRRGKGGGNA